MLHQAVFNSNVNIYGIRSHVQLSLFPRPSLVFAAQAPDLKGDCAPIQSIKHVTLNHSKQNNRKEGTDKVDVKCRGVFLSIFGHKPRAKAYVSRHRTGSMQLMKFSLLVLEAENSSCQEIKKNRRKKC